MKEMTPYLQWCNSYPQFIYLLKNSYFSFRLCSMVLKQSCFLSLIFSLRNTLMFITQIHLSAQYTHCRLTCIHVECNSYPQFASHKSSSLLQTNNISTSPFFIHQLLSSMQNSQLILISSQSHHLHTQEHTKLDIQETNFSPCN